jgi:curved DNA-binding protein CbpA
MNGQLSEHPPAELIREISAKSLGGRLRLEHDRVKVVAYFDSGNFLYAASNLRTLRLREYLLKGNVMAEQDLARFNDRVSDADLIKALCSQNLIAPAVAEQIRTRQVSDVLRLALLWTEGTWEFESGLRLDEYLNLNIDACSLLLDAGRRMPETFAASRFRDPAEVIAAVESLQLNTSLLPAEVFLLSRLDKPMVLRELIAISGLGESETLQIVYSLVLAGLIKRQHWGSAFRDPQPAPHKTVKETTPVAEPTPEMSEPEIAADDVESFLERMRNAQTHYDVLGVTTEVKGENLKTVYYQLAKRYHPDRFRKAEASVVTRLESAFARITQAYDTLRDDALRSRYNAKLETRRKAKELAESAPKATTSAPQPEQAVESSAEPSVSAVERAEIQFKEGFAALEMGERKVALGLFASAASAVPSEARYRAFYGQVLAGDERTRRAAEAELNAAIRLEPANAEYRVMLAELYRDLGLKLRAKGEAERAMAADPNNRKARELLKMLK